MSIKLMASAWELDIPSTEKMVLLCLCDYAGDEGSCWPSVPTIARKCSKGERTVQSAIQWLRGEGYCTWDETPGKPHRFRLDPRKICAPQHAPDPRKSRTPANLAPPQDLHQTPAESAGEPLRTIISSEAKASSLRPWSCPTGVDPDHWRDFLANRKTRRLTNTATAYHGQLKAIAELADDEWPPGRLVEYAAMKGWGSINKPEEGSFNGQGNQGSGGRMGGPRPDPTLAIVRAAREAQRQDGRNYS